MQKPTGKKSTEIHKSSICETYERMVIMMWEEFLTLTFPYLGRIVQSSLHITDYISGNYIKLFNEREGCCVSVSSSKFGKRTWDLISSQMHRIQLLVKSDSFDQILSGLNLKVYQPILSVKVGGNRPGSLNISQIWRELCMHISCR